MHGDSIIRSATEADAEAVLAIYRPFVEETAISFEMEPPSLEELRQRIREAVDQRAWLVWEGGGGLSGYAYAAAHRARHAYGWSVEPSVYVSPQHRRKGVARALYLALFEVLRGKGFCNAYAGIALPNPASISFHQALGFEPVGTFRNVGFKLGRWHDVSWWQLQLHQPLPVPPSS